MDPDNGELEHNPWGGAGEDDDERTGPSSRQQGLGQPRTQIIRLSLDDLIAVTGAETTSNSDNNANNAQSQSTRVSELTLAQLALLMRIYRRTGGDDDDDDDDENDDEQEEEDLDNEQANNRRHGPPRPKPLPKEALQAAKEPQPRGVELLMSGEFGRVGYRRRRKMKMGDGSSEGDVDVSWDVDMNVAGRVMDRRYAVGVEPVEDLAMNLVPNSDGTVVAMYDADVYSGQFSLDSSFYYTCCRDFRMHIYDLSHPPIPWTPPSLPPNPNLSRPTPTRRIPRPPIPGGHASTMQVLKTIRGQSTRWTITDSHLSPDNQWMIYASHMSTVYMVKTLDTDPIQIPLNFSDPLPNRRRPPTASSARDRESFWNLDPSDDSNCSIWSARFSADGKEVVAGGDEKLFVYDIPTNRRTVKIRAHTDDINSVCFADSSSTNILISASDDSFLKVWDRRSLRSSSSNSSSSTNSSSTTFASSSNNQNQKPSGVLIGHTEGITYVAAKGDGRYVISNGKDQVVRLWDLRGMRSSVEYDGVKDEAQRYCVPGYDYRYGRYRKPRYAAHPMDCSVMAYRGHAVFRTLIRCHFSPAATTGGKYIYSGSADGKVYIWSLDGTIVQTLDRRKTLPMTFDPSAAEEESDAGQQVSSSNIIRDVSWHAYEPILMSAAWADRDAPGSYSCVARHEWKGLNKMGGRLEDWVEKRRCEARERGERQRRTGSGTRSMLMPGSFVDDEDDDRSEEMEMESGEE